MLKITSFFFLCLLWISSVLPSPLFAENKDDLQHTSNSTKDGILFMELTAEELSEAARYDPTRANAYHLFTRENPTVSQPLLFNNPDLIQNSNFKNSRRTIVLIHGWLETASSDFNAVLIPAFLAAEDVNIIVVDWSTGASSIIYRLVILNTIASGRAVAQFIDWLNEETQSSGDQYHIVGHGFGGHQAGIVGRNVQDDIAYVTGLDPANIGWVNHIERFRPTDGIYTEVIHTNYGINGYLADLAQVDFYPNGGISMPGCDSNACDHARSYFYFAESLASGGFTGRQCFNYFAAILSACETLPGRLQMGGLKPKTGSSGVYYLETNPSPPFSQE